MILYAKWAKGNPQHGFLDGLLDGLGRAMEWVKALLDEMNLEWMGGQTWLFAVPFALLLLLLVLLKRRKCRVVFETNGGAPIEPIKVKRNQTLQNLPVPVRGYSLFCGWYKDAAMTDPWYAGADQVKKKKQSSMPSGCEQHIPERKTQCERKAWLCWSAAAAVTLR